MEKIYILEARAFLWANGEHVSLLEAKEWIAYGELGRKKLEKTLKQIAKIWKKVYVDERDDTQVTIHLYNTVLENGFILKDDVCDYQIIGGGNNG